MSGLGVVKVNGRIRVPLPAANIMAWRMGWCCQCLSIWVCMMWLSLFSNMTKMVMIKTVMTKTVDDTLATRHLVTKIKTLVPPAKCAYFAYRPG